MPYRLILAGIVVLAILVFLSWRNFTYTDDNISTKSDYPIQKFYEDTEAEVKPNPFDEKSEMRILFLGDLMEDRYIRQMAEKHQDPCYSFSLVSDFLKKYDLVIANNEGTITGKNSISQNTTPEQKEHFRFTFPPDVLRCYQENNIKLVSIGNNHILDFGREGLEETIDNLKSRSINYFGDPYDGNRNFSELDVPGGKLALVAYNAFFGMKPNQVVSQIQNLKAKGDSVIVYCHWGVEYETRATQTQKTLARLFIDAGADAVVGSHPHVIEEEENYRGKPIFYSLGNFIFDQYFSTESKKGLGVELAIKKSSAWEWRRHYFENAPTGQVKYINLK